MTQRYYSLGLIGYPLEGSYSPDLHQAALQACGLEGEYRLYPLPPLPGWESELASLLDLLRRGKLDGLNVTIPHKQAVFRLVDELTPAARAIQAVNTLVMEAGRLLGDNTDAPGFSTDLQRLAFPLLKEVPGHALVLGAGGAARAVTYALLESGWSLTVAARRMEQAQDLVSSMQALFPSCLIQAISLQVQALSSLQPLPGLIVNATPVGMIPDEDGSPWPEAAPFPAGAVLYDLVYKPPETLLVRSARQAGLPAFNGLGMLVEQAALSFERWTGHSASRQAMCQAAGYQPTGAGNRPPK